MRFTIWCAVLAALAMSMDASAADKWQLKEGRPELRSVGPMAFGPDGILLVSDPMNAAVFAVATGESSGSSRDVSVSVEHLNAQVAKALGAQAGDVTLVDIAANPFSGSVFLAVMQGSGSQAKPALVRVGADGSVKEFGLEKVWFSSVLLPNPPEDKEIQGRRGPQNMRTESITDLAYVDGRVIVSGLSTGESPSSVRQIAFPFAEADSGSSVEIYHGAHGKAEDYAAIRTFVPFNINGEASLLAGYVCTPLVKFPLSDLKAGEKTRGTTVAELGNRNRPLDMIAYRKDGKDFLLLANSARGVMKISTENIASNKGINDKIDGVAGQPYETIASLQGVVQLDRLNDSHAVIVTQADNGDQTLATVALP